MKKMSIVLMIFMSLLFLSSCKSKTEIKRQVSRMVNFYDATSIMDKYEETNQKFITLNSRRSYRDSEYYYSTVMYLQYDFEEQSFYGEYESKKELLDSKNDDSENKDVYYVKLDKEGYHPQKGKTIPDDVKNFEYMFEVVNLNGGGRDGIKLKSAIYNFELPEYIVDYELIKQSDDINEYLKNIGFIKYGTGYLMSFTVDNHGTNDFTNISLL